MSVSVKIVFSGLIALVLSEEIPVVNTGQKEKDTGPATAYLLEEYFHIPELLIHKDDVADPGEAEKGAGSCEQGSTHGCAKKHKSNYTVVECKPGAYTHFVWCLKNREIVVSQSTTAVASYLNGIRKGKASRYLEYGSPREITGDPKTIREDISWVAEMAKIKPNAKLDVADVKIASVMRDLRGRIVSVGVPDTPVWNWCALAGGKYKVSNEKKKYDQAIAEQVQVELMLASPYVTLHPRSDTALPVSIKIRNPPAEPIHVANGAKYGSGPSTKSGEETEDGRDWCVATHFAHHYRLLKMTDGERLPFYAGKCPSPSAPAVLAVYRSLTDAFCPPVIFKGP